MTVIRRFSLPIVATLLLAASADAQTGFPFQDETLHYSINWPSGLSLGESSFTASRTTAGWDFAMTLNAAIPGFAVNDKVHATSTQDQCSLSLERDITHGRKHTREKTAYDQEKRTASRTTVLPANGGRSTFDIPMCARDALAYFYFARRELGQGRVPPPQQVFFGSSYSVRMEYTGAVTIPVADKTPQVTDHVVVSVKGQKSDVSFEVFFARDAARTPLLFKVPFPMGTFSMELAR